MEKQGLAKNYEEIIDYLKKEGFNIFYSKNISEDGVLPEIIWDNQDNSWKEFFAIAKKEDINTIIVEKENFKKEDFDKFEGILKDKFESKPDIINQFQQFFSDLKKHQNELGTFIFSWIKNNTKYSLSEKTPWFEEFQEGFEELQAQAKHLIRHRTIETDEREEIPKEIKEKDIDELADEFFNYLQKEFPNAGRHEIYTAKKIFWQEKGVDRFYTGKGRILIDKVSNIVERKLEAREKEILPQLVDECVKWTRDNELNKITKSNINGFLAEKGINLSSTSKDVLYNKANIKLKQT